MTSNGTLTTDSRRVLSRSSVDDGVNENLDGVKFGDEVDDFESVLNDSDGHEFFTVVSAVHHETVRRVGISDESVSCAETRFKICVGKTVMSLWNVALKVDRDIKLLTR